MTIQNKKKYLKRYKELYYKIKTLEDEIEKIETKEEGGSIDYSRVVVQTTPTNDQLINYCIKKDEVYSQLIRLKCEAMEARHEIISTISSISDDTYQTVLFRRYIKLETWEQISEFMNYSTQRLYELHCEALAEMNIRVHQS